MAPKSQTDLYCIRCPDEFSLSVYRHEYKLAKCFDKYSTEKWSASQLWFLFEDGPSTIDDSDLTACHAVLDLAMKTLTAKNNGVQDWLEKVREKAKTATYENHLITKGTLEAAACKVLKIKERQGREKVPQKVGKGDKKLERAEGKADGGKTGGEIGAAISQPTQNDRVSTGMDQLSINNTPTVSTSGSNVSSSTAQTTSQSLAASSSVTTAAASSAPPAQSLQVATLASASATPSNSAATGPLAPSAPSGVSALLQSTLAPAGGGQGGVANNFGVPGPKSALELHCRRPGLTASDGHVVTNHFEVTLQSGKVLYEYEVQGLQRTPTLDISAPKRKALFKRFLENSPILSPATTQLLYATDGERKIIACQDLSTLHGSTAVAAPAILEQQLVPDYDGTQQNVPSRNISVNLVHTRVIDLGGLHRFVTGGDEQYREVGAAEAINTLVGKGVAVNNPNAYLVGGNKYFDSNLGNAQGLGGHGLRAINGFFSSIRPSNGRLTLNVNTAVSAFHDSKLVSQYISQDYNGTTNFMANERAKNHLTGLRVRIMYNRCKIGEADQSKDTEPRRTKTITGFSSTIASETMFTDRNGNLISVWDHFKQSYPVAAATSNGNQICVNTRGTTPGTECWFMPDQLLVLPVQMYRKTLDKLDSNMTQSMIRIACRTADTNRDMIALGGLQTLGMVNRGLPPVPALPQVLTRSGINIRTQMMTVPTRRIPYPHYIYENQSVQARNATWMTRGLRFISRAHLNGSVVFCRPSRQMAHPNLARDYITEFNMSWRLNGITGNNAAETWVDIPDFSIDELRRQLDRFGHRNPALFVLVLPEQDVINRSRHAAFHIVCDQMLGKPMIVFCEARMAGSIGNNYQRGSQIGRSGLRPYIANNAMKVNLRLGGANHTVAPSALEFLFARKDICDTLVLGADLIHPESTSADGTPSIAAVVGNVDDNFAKFLGSVRRQDAGSEIIDENNMKAMVVERIKAWQDEGNHEDRMPARILYYRDGVSETQYHDIRREELRAIRNAWQQVAKDQQNTPKITAFVVTKRHNTRFYPLSNAPAAHKARANNCLAGTVVDAGVTSPYYFDFFLQSHNPLQGTAKPTHYFVLENGMNFTTDGMQDLTNALCYVFQHSTSAVSYVSPAYYADKLCERAALYLKSFFDGEGSVRTMTAAQRQTEIVRRWSRGGQGANGNPWHVRNNSKMFWM